MGIVRRKVGSWELIRLWMPLHGRGCAQCLMNALAKSINCLLNGCFAGWAFYTMVLGTLLVFISAVFSMKAEEATSSDKVESKVLDGKHIICII